jgi:hypothetical protein
MTLEEAKERKLQRVLDLGTRLGTLCTQEQVGVIVQYIDAVIAFDRWEEEYAVWKGCLMNKCEKINKITKMIYLYVVPLGSNWTTEDNCIAWRILVQRAIQRHVPQAEIWVDRTFGNSSRVRRIYIGDEDCSHDPDLVAYFNAAEEWLRPAGVCLGILDEE